MKLTVERYLQDETLQSRLELAARRERASYMTNLVASLFARLRFPYRTPLRAAECT
jgi:hypothetical protein